MTETEYWQGDRDREFERDLYAFAKREFRGIFKTSQLEIAKVTDLLRAYARHLNPDPEIKPFVFHLRGDVVVVTVTEEN